jgi:hypothetical protein
MIDFTAACRRGTTDTAPSTAGTPTATQIAALGYGAALVSVIPPAVDLSPNSTLKPRALGKIPGKLGSEGWYGIDHLKSPSDAAQIERDCANVGLQSAHFPGLDIDVRSAKLAGFFLLLAKRRLGAAPVRLSVEPRRLLMYRTDVPFARMAMVVKWKGESHLIEMLGAKRQYLIAGTHPSGAAYRWEQPVPPVDDLTTITQAQVVAYFDEAERLLRAKGIELERIGSGKIAEAAPPQEHLLAPSVADVQRVVELIPNRETDGWERHIEMGYAIRAACGEEHKADALEIWESWNERWEGGLSVAETNEDSWRRLHPPYRVGWSWLQEQAETLGDYTSAQDEFGVDADASPPASTAGPIAGPLEELNESYAVVQVGSDVVIMQERGVEPPVFLTQTSFALRFSNREVPSAHGRPGATEPLTKAWLAWPQRREYDRVVFKPGDLDTAPDYNLWQGWAVEPSPTGSCDLFLRHLRDVVCLGEDAHAEWLLDFLAHIFVAPQQKPGVTVGLQGVQGSGKSIVGDVIGKLIGSAYHVTANTTEQVVGRFNAHLAQCLLLQAEEAFWAGNKSAEGALKHLVTGATQRIERKGIDSEEMPSFTRLFITSNEDRLWPTAIDDRRLAIFRVSDERVGDRGYFNALFAELDAGGYSKLLHTLLSRRVDIDRLRHAPRTAALVEQAEQSLSHEESWLLGLLTHGKLEGVSLPDGGVRVTASSLRDSYLRSLPARAYAKNPQSFGRFLQKQLGTTRAGSRTRVGGMLGVRTYDLEVPLLSACRVVYSARGRAAMQDWDDPDAAWVVGGEFAAIDELTEGGAA